jgi:hypothetical protein
MGVAYHENPSTLLVYQTSLNPHDFYCQSRQLNQCSRECELAWLISFQKYHIAINPS